jgi:2-keto-4-pentenoate hydratase/2-oxohepta-3-ene-1,7-dioic acid hydratase in catechol pathway
MKRVRYSFDRNLPATAPDGPEVLYGEFGAIDLSSVRLLPPCAPSKIVCVGRNYAEHARELGNEAPSEPLIFLKPPSALSASGDPIVYPPISERVDWEGELGVVIGKRCRNVTTEEAMDYVLGYTFCAVGPCLVGRNDLDFDSLRVRTVVDGEVKQEAPVTDMIFKVPVIISYISRVMTLEPGDLIATGTPEGVGPVQPGQVMRIEIDGIGALENPVVKG